MGATGETLRVLARGGAALFESWRGRWADSPRAISTSLATSRPDLPQVWVVEDDGAGLPAGTPWVRRNSPAYAVALGAARWVVNNDMFPRWPVHRRRTSYLQTWHGTPLKRIGFDVDTTAWGISGQYQRRLARDVARWDALVSPSPWATDVLRRAFRYDGPVLETGYPRNDVLAGAGANERRARVRRALGLPEHVRAVLYAPTWRDDQRDAAGRPVQDVGVDLARVAAALPDVEFLVRYHAVVANRPDPSMRGVRDVTDHPDVQALLLAADVLVTDYSSVMFDHASTGRPQVLLAPDLERYRDQVRGFYLPYEQTVAGPVVRTGDELVDVLAATGSLHEDWAARRRAFRDRFAPLDDGEASRRVVEEVFT